MAGEESQRLTAEGEGEAEPEASVRWADRPCPRCRTWFVGSYYRGDEYIKSKCMECQLFWPTPLMA